MTDRVDRHHDSPMPAEVPSAELHEDVVEVRRSAGVLALVTVGAAALGLLYGVRAFAGSPVLGLVALVLVGIACVAGRAWYDARSPLLVADGLGVRIRHGDAWRGLPWADVDHVVLAEPRGLVRDGAVDVVARDGTAYVVPLGLTTRASHEDLGHALVSLSGDDRIVVRPQVSARSAAAGAREDEGEADGGSASAVEAVEPAPDPETPRSTADPSGSADAREPVASGGSPHVRGPAGASTPVPAGADEGPSGPARIDLGLTASVGSSALAPGYRVVTALRADRGRPELVIDRPVEETQTHHGERAAAASAVDAATDTVVPAADDTASDSAAGSTAADSTADSTADGTKQATTAQVDEPTPEPERVRLGTMLRAARERAGVSVDDLAARTQIRPHIIEALEDDDAGACGGDFYARGHLRAIARTLGTDPEPWLETYDASYAQAPVPARAVFEAERSIGAQSIRVARGGRSWVALTVAVLVLAIIWGVGQLVVGGDGDAPTATVPTEAAPPPADPSAMAGLGAPTTNHIVIRGKEKKPTKVKVSDARGKTVWSGDLAKGEFRRVSVVGPAKVTVNRADAATVAVNGKKARRLGDGSSKTTATVGDS